MSVVSPERRVLVVVLLRALTFLLRVVDFINENLDNCYSACAPESRVLRLAVFVRIVSLQFRGSVYFRFRLPFLLSFLCVSGNHTELLKLLVVARNFNKLNGYPEWP